MDMLSERERWETVVVLLLSAVLRLYGLGLSEFYGDEVMIIGRSIALSKALSNPINLGIVLVHIHPPVEIVLPIPFLLLLGVTEFTARLPFALSGIASIYLVCRVAKALFSNRVGILSAALLCFCGFHMMFSRIVMATSIELTLILLTMVLLLEGSAGSRIAAERRWVILGIALGFSFLTQYYTILILPAIIYFLRTTYGGDWWKDKKVRLALASTLVTVVPFYLVYLSAPVLFAQIGPTLGANYILQRGVGEFGFHVIYFLKSFINYCSIPYLCLLAFGLLLGLKFLNDKSVRFCWIWLLSFFVPFMFLIRAPVVVYVMDGVPPLLILASKGLDRLESNVNSSPRRIDMARKVFPLLICSVILLSSFHTYNYVIQLNDTPPSLIFTLQIQGAHYRPYKSGWKAAGWFIRENTRSSDLYVSDGEGFVTRYYTNRKYLCEISQFFEYVNSSDWSNVRFILLSAMSQSAFPGAWSYVAGHYFLTAIVRYRSLDSIFIYSTEPIHNYPEILLPENVDGLFDAKYGKSPEAILSIYV